MACEQVIDFMADYVDRALPKRQLIGFRLHLLLCRACRRYLASYRTTLEAARAVGRQPQPLEMGAPPEELIQAILAARGKKPHEQ